MGRAEGSSVGAARPQPPVIGAFLQLQMKFVQLLGESFEQ